MGIRLIKDLRQVPEGFGVKLNNYQSYVADRVRPSYIFNDSSNVSINDVTLKGCTFSLDINQDWVLNGHRFFINENYGFFTDREIAWPDEFLYKLLATDLDTSIKYDVDAKEFYLGNDYRDRQEVQVDGLVGVACSVEPSNFGSFLVRVLPKAIQLKAANTSKIFVYSNYQSQFDLLNLVGWTDEKIIRQNPRVNYKFNHGLYLSEPTEQLFISPHLKNIFNKFKSPKKDSKIYVSRKNDAFISNSRYCINHEEVEFELRKIGFEIIYPAELSVIDQIKYFSEATMVVGPSGAGMFNTVFCHSGTKVIDIESEPDWVHGHCNLFSSLELDYQIHWAIPELQLDIPPPHRPFRIKVSALIDQIQHF